MTRIRNTLAVVGAVALVGVTAGCVAAVVAVRRLASAGWSFDY